MDDGKNDDLDQELQKEIAAISIPAKWLDEGSYQIGKHVYQIALVPTLEPGILRIRQIQIPLEEWQKARDGKKGQEEKEQQEENGRRAEPRQLKPKSTQRNVRRPVKQRVVARKGSRNAIRSK